MPRLDFYSPDSHRRPFVKFSLTSDDVVIGRGAECTVQLPEERVSRQHAVISRRGDSYWIEDSSLHGTRLNAEKLEAPAVLKAGDRIYIERFVIVFQEDDAAVSDLDEATTWPD